MSSDPNPPPAGEQPATPQGGEPSGEAEGPGVLGSLPRSRPSVRSPRRPRSAPKQAAEPGEVGPTTPRSEPIAGPDPQSRPQPSGKREEPHTAGREGPEAELERLARAGLSVAGGAAALGLRAAGRAAAALRDAVERR